MKSSSRTALGHGGERANIRTIFGVAFATTMAALLLLPGDADAGCETNPSSGVVMCGAGGCAVDTNTGVVWCSRFRGGGAAVNRNTGAVICGVGDCAVNGNNGVVFCSPFGGGSAATNANTGQVICTSDTGAAVDCVEGRSENCDMATVPE